MADPHVGLDVPAAVAFDVNLDQVKGTWDDVAAGEREVVTELRALRERDDLYG